MCGINGIFIFKNCVKNYPLESIVRQMNERIIKRGPDSEGVFVGRNVALGMRRLAIIDVQNGNQPIKSIDGNLTIVYNGEVYNYRDIRKNLTAKGHIFSTDSDVEVVLQAYEEYGADCLNHFDGMFAFAIYDSRQDTVFLARDKMGVKPCCYALDDDKIIFSSTVEAVVSTGIVEKKIDNIALAQYLQLTYIPSPRSIFEGVRKLPAGCWARISSDGTIKWKCYSDLRPGDGEPILDLGECQKQLREALYRSVERRMISDVPVGAFLSGGIDSTIVTGIMSELSSRPIDTFTIGFDEKEYDETGRAEIASRFHHTNHHLFRLRYDDAINRIDDVLRSYDEPFADNSAIPSFFVSQLAHDNSIKVVLTGDAGDEMFGGYNKYLIEYYSTKYKQFPAWSRSFFERILSLMPDTSSLSRKVLKVIRNAQCDSFIQQRNLMCLGFKEAELSLLLQNEHGTVGTSLNNVKELYDSLPEGTNPLMRQFLVDWKIVLEGCMHVKMDRVSLANSVETRAPLIGSDVVDIAMRTPTQFKINGNKLKVILRNTFKDKIPRELLSAPKHGFGVPTAEWFRNQMKLQLETMLSQSVIEDQGIFSYSYIHRLLQEHQSRRINHGRQLWTLYAFQKWYERFMV